MAHRLAGPRLSKAKFADQLRANMTPAELALWRELADGQLGAWFEPQVVLRGYIVDFYCRELGVVVEVDGSIHDAPHRQAADALRTRHLETAGFRVVRLRNDEVLTDPAAAAARLRSMLPTRAEVVLGLVGRALGHAIIYAAKATAALLKGILRGMASASRPRRRRRRW